MSELLLEGALSALMACLLAYLWRVGRARAELRCLGWRYVLWGVFLAMAGSFLHLADPLVAAWPGKALDHAVAVEAVAALIQAVGIATLGAGLFLWIPRMTSYRQLTAVTEKYRTLIEATSDWLWEVDEHFRYTNVSPRVKNCLGFEPQEVLGRTFFDLMPPGEARRVATLVAETAKERRPFRRLESVTRHKDGRIVVLEMSGMPILDDCGRFCGYRGGSCDVTKRRQVEREFAASERRYRLLAQYAYDVIWTSDLAIRLQYVSPSCARLFGFSPEEMTALSLHEFLTPTSAEQTLTILHTRLAEAQKNPAIWTEAINVELEFRRKDGSTVWAEVNASFILDEEGAPIGLVGVTRDLTARRAFQTQLEEARRAAESASLAKSQFLANMSHEIRTPMTAILGYVDLLGDGCCQRCEFGQQALNEYLRVVRRNADHLLEVINDILDLSKVEAGRLEVERAACFPHRVLAEAVSLAQVRAEGKALPIVLEYRGSVPEVIQSDPVRLRQILTNLIVNAVKFTESGEIRVVASCEESRTPYPRLRIDVIDTGIGIAEDQLARLFEPFSQADTSTTRRFGGTGLGLVISQRLAHALGGEIRVRSDLGRGSTFTVTVTTGPLDRVRMIDAKAAETEVAKPAPCANSVPDVAGRVLLAEDGPDNQRLISLLLRKAGADVTVVDNGQEACLAVEAAVGEGRPFDLILMDMQMPVMDGYAATRRLREQGCTTPVIALTAHAMSTDRQKCLDAGCDEYATKPIDRTVLLAMAAQHIQASLADPAAPVDGTP